MKSVLCVGVLVLDIVFEVPELPHGGEKMLGHGIAESVGGPAAIGGLAIVKLGGRAAIVSRLGDDRTGDAIEEGFRAHGVEFADVPRLKGVPSSLSSVALNPAGERQIVNYTDPALHLTAPDRLPSLDGYDAVLTDTIWPSGAASALAAARTRGLPAVVDFDVAPKGGPGDILANATHVAFSHQGLTALTGEHDIEQALRKLGASYDARFVVTLGDAGLAWLEDGAIQRMPAFKVNVVDTLGAGDVFHGGFTLGLAEGMSMADALRFGSAAAAVKCTRKGGGPGAPSRAEVEALIRAQG